MATRTEDFRRQVNELWHEAVTQLDEVRKAVGGRIEAETLRLRRERDDLLKRLGEQTYRLANDGSLPVPAIIKRTVERLNDVIAGLVKKGGGAKKRRPAKAGARKKKSTPRSRSAATH